MPWGVQLPEQTNVLFADSYLPLMHLLEPLTCIVDCQPRSRSACADVVLTSGPASVQPRLAALSVTEFVAAAGSAKSQFAQLVPAYLDVSVGAWAIVE